MNKFIIIVCMSVLLGLAFGEKNPIFGKQEPACISQGGQCMVESQCMSPIDLQGELCLQKGYQCCSGFPKDEKRCKMHGGECFKRGFCNPRIVFDEATDCGRDQDCCILM